VSLTLFLIFQSCNKKIFFKKTHHLPCYLSLTIAYKEDPHPCSETVLDKNCARLKIGTESLVKGVGDQIHGQLGQTEVLVAASHDRGFGQDLFLNRDDFTCRARLGPEGSHVHHIDRVGGRGW